MPKIDLDVVKDALAHNQVESEKAAAVMNDLLERISADQNDEEKPPPVKKQFVVLVSDPEGQLEGMELTGWVMQIPEEEPPPTTEERIFKAAHEYMSTSRRARKSPANTVAQACENVPAKLFKEYQLWVKTKEPVWILRSNNEVPDYLPDEGEISGESSASDLPDYPEKLPTSPEDL